MEQERVVAKKPEVEFHGGMIVALLPLLIFVVVAMLCFVVFKVFDMEALAAGAFVGLIVTSLLAKNFGKFWTAAQHGLGNDVSTIIILIFFVISIFTKLMTKSGVAQGFVWLGNAIGMTGGLFTMFTFIATCIISTAIGSSIGTTFSAFPIFYPSGLLLGCNPALLAGAIISGAVFGDNLAPVSDTTIASASTQTYTRKSGSADIGGCVASRLKYSLVGGAIACVLFAVFGGGGSLGVGAEEILAANMNPLGLTMLIPVAALLYVAIKTRDVFKSIIVGIFVGTAVGLITGLLKPSDIVMVSNGAMSGFIFEGIKGIMATVTFTMSLFAITGVLNESGAMDKFVDIFSNSKFAKTARGAESVIAAGSVIATTLLGGVSGASVIMFGPIADKIGKTQKLHPYRRANLTDGFCNSLPIAIPFLSAFVFIGASIIDGLAGTYGFVTSLNPLNIGLSIIYPMVLFAVLLVAVITGWGRRYEGPDGKPVKTLAEAEKE